MVCRIRLEHGLPEAFQCFCIEEEHADLEQYVGPFDDPQPAPLELVAQGDRAP